MTVDGRRVDRGGLDVPADRATVVGGRRLSRRVHRCARRRAATLVVRFTPRRGPARRGRRRGWTASASSIELVPARPAAGAAPRRRSIDVEVGDDGIVARRRRRSAGRQLSLWRAPTDNDDPPGEWRATTPAARLAGRRARSPRRRRRRGPPRAGAVTRVVSYATGAGHPIEHRQRIEVVDRSQLRISEVISVDRIAARPAAGRRARSSLPAEFDRADVARPRPRRLLSRSTGGCPLRPVGRRTSASTSSRSSGRRSTGCTSTPSWFELASPRLVAAASPVTGRWRSRRCRTRSRSWRRRRTPTCCRRRRRPTSTSTSPTAASAPRRAGPTPTRHLVAGAPRFAWTSAGAPDRPQSECTNRCTAPEPGRWV